MNRDQRFGKHPTESENIVSLAPTYNQRSSRHEVEPRRVSFLDGMSSIPESEATASQNAGHSQNRTALLPPQEPPQQPNSPSLFRRITTRLSTPKILSPAIVSSAIPLNTLSSLRRSRGREYENLHDAEDDDNGRDDNIPVDLSLLSGLGFELTEAEQSRTESYLDQDTRYRSLHVDQAKPGFQDFVRRRQLGDGLVVGAKLTRDPSIQGSNSPSTRAQEVQRRRTVRNAAQNYAQHRNMIVAVSEPVDLSVLEGPIARQGTSQSFDTMLNRSGTMGGEAPMSYFFPEDPDVPNWRPITMSTPFILFLTTAAFGLAACQEYLYQKSRQLEDKNSGILAFDSVNDLSVGIFFVWKYLPTMITIIYAVMFSVMDFDIRRLEPFYQLSQPKGSPASESLNVDHLTTFQYFVPFKAFRLKQWTVFLSTIANIIASTISPALQNPSVDFDTNEFCRQPNGQLDCPTDDIKQYIVVVLPVWSRLLSASYIIVGTIAFALFLQLRRKSGLLSDPKGIAGIASMATKSHILRDFKGTDLYTRQDLAKRLAHRQFILYKSSIWQGQFSVDNEPEFENKRSPASPHPPMLRMNAAYPFIAAQIFCLIAVPLISLTKANIVPNTVPWLPILIATVLKLVWSTFEADVRLMEPFYQLSLGMASPETSLTLDYQSTIYGLLPFKAAYNGHWLLCIVGLCSVALDVLTVTVSSFSIQADVFYSQIGHEAQPGDPKAPDSDGDESEVSFWTSVILSLVILIFVIFTTVLVYIRRRHPFLPREPSTIASILAFIYASNMLEDFIDTETMTNQQMEKMLKAKKKKYALGWFKGRDNQVHCAIDQEPIRSKYVHGKPYAQAMAGPLDDHGGYYA